MDKMGNRNSIKLKDMKPTQENLIQIRLMMLVIKERITSEVEINDSTVSSLALNLISGKYDTIVMYHGQEFAEALLKIYEDCELYETCAYIKEDIENVNKLLDTTKRYA